MEREALPRGGAGGQEETVERRDTASSHGLKRESQNYEPAAPANEAEEFLAPSYMPGAVLGAVGANGKMKYCPRGT